MSPAPEGGIGFVFRINENYAIYILISNDLFIEFAYKRNTEYGEMKINRGIKGLIEQFNLTYSIVKEDLQREKHKQPVI